MNLKQRHFGFVICSQFVFKVCESFEAWTTEERISPQPDQAAADAGRWPTRSRSKARRPSSSCCGADALASQSDPARCDLSPCSAAACTCVAHRPDPDMALDLDDHIIPALHMQSYDTIVFFYLQPSNDSARIEVRQSFNC